MEAGDAGVEWIVTRRVGRSDFRQLTLEGRGSATGAGARGEGQARWRWRWRAGPQHDGARRAGPVAPLPRSRDRTGDLAAAGGSGKSDPDETQLVEPVARD